MEAVHDPIEAYLAASRALDAGNVREAQRVTARTRGMKLVTQRRTPMRRFARRSTRAAVRHSAGARRRTTTRSSASGDDGPGEPCRHSAGSTVPASWIGGAR